jgi:plastocyanin
MKTLHLSIIILLTSGLLAFTTNSVYAPCLVGVTDCGPPPGVTVSTWTDSQFYEKNDAIDLKGKLYVENYTNPIQVQIINPTNMTVQTLETIVNNNMFSVKINANFNDSGMYQIITCVKSWCDRSYFKYTAEPYHLFFNGGNYLIWYKSIADLQKIDVDVGAQALRVHISGATAEGLQFVITLPRDLIDFQSARGDQNFTVLVGAQQPDKYMQPASYKEIATNSLSRTLAVDIPYKPMSDEQGIWDFKITGPDVLSGPSVFSDPPLKQFKSGISTNNIVCKEGLYLAIKSQDKEPTCLKAGTISKLASRGFLYGINASETNYTTILIPPGSEDPSSNKTYSPDVATVVIGINNTVTWVNQAEAANTIAPDMPLQQDGKSFGSDVLRPGGSYQFTFTEPGTFAYHGEPHPWQRGKIIVLPPSNNTSVSISKSYNLKQVHYYDSSNLNPGVTLYDYSYDGIDKDGLVSINNQTFYQTTLDNDIYKLKGMSMQFHNVTFSFPEGTLITPGGAFVNLDVKFQDDFEEIYGGTMSSPVGSEMLGGIPTPTQYGPHLAVNSITVLGNHTMPQAGLTIDQDKVKLLVSANDQVSQK